jgi:hypothetical protein
VINSTKASYVAANAGLRLRCIDMGRIDNCIQDVGYVHAANKGSHLCDREGGEGVKHLLYQS